jgi:hypothetical protein
MKECFCGEEISNQRWNLGYHLCLSCGDKEAKNARKSWTIVPLSKSNYTLITDMSLLKELNKVSNS